MKENPDRLNTFWSSLNITAGYVIYWFTQFGYWKLWWILVDFLNPGVSSAAAAAAASLQSSDSVWPHRRQPTRLPHPWDSPGKNARVGCHFLLQCMKVKSESEVAQLSPTPSNPMDCSLPGSAVYYRLIIYKTSLC